MSDERPFGPMDPNSEHQRWSSWVFGVTTPVKRPDVPECVDNARRYFHVLFGSVGRVRCTAQGDYYVFEIDVEGPPVHDPDYVQSVKRDFVRRFMQKGFGPSATLTRFHALLRAGSREDGSPPDQFLVMPGLASTAKLFTV